MKSRKKQYRKSMLSFHDEDEQSFDTEEVTDPPGLASTLEEGETMTDLESTQARTAFRDRIGRKAKTMAFSSRRSRPEEDVMGKGAEVPPGPIREVSNSWEEPGEVTYGDTAPITSNQSQAVEEEEEEDGEGGLTKEERAMITEARKRRRAQRQGVAADYISLSSGASSKQSARPMGRTMGKRISFSAAMDHLPSALQSSDTSSPSPSTLDRVDDRRDQVREALKSMYGDTEERQVQDTSDISPGPAPTPSSKLSVMGELEDLEDTYTQEAPDQIMVDVGEDGEGSDHEELARWESDVIRQGGMMSKEGLDNLISQEPSISRSPPPPTPQITPLISFPDFTSTLDRACMELKESIETTEESLGKHQQMASSLPAQQTALNEEATQTYTRYLFYQETLDWVNDTVAMMESKIPKFASLEEELQKAMEGQGARADQDVANLAWERAVQEDGRLMDEDVLDAVEKPLETSTHLDDLSNRRSMLFDDVKDDFSYAGALERFERWHQTHPEDYGNAYAGVSFAQLAGFYARWECLGMTHIHVRRYFRGGGKECLLGTY
ncbi:hypothetical protein BJ684DRAFT_21678 [Piptocephalis cylindrospora]|uniref:Uncharacterized protein n=1 Tax=Piptocephalis cylindrospora TaxID=1907219 RepID=A0A4V1IXP1_9FUNG|nr:hypothetical protein BJ684DRAFT_21678 [Piptocephalis cylindrospora]|eukprot:RKP11739.1 hypothetical protein BJ684DRAFT_21678 [Piptocephalis cylindrospora]